ncbi:MAG: serine/threonine-protein kinase [Polyangiales bacterium]
MVSTPELGSLVGDKYQIVRSLGVGGMGAVFEAEHVVTGKRCAVKWLRPQPGARASDRQRAIHEARAACRIHHENVVDVYDVLEQDGSIYLVMELLSGEPLSALLARDPPPPAALIALLLPAMRGLSALHAAGVVHRDVKPHNIFLANEPGHRSEVAKIIDFGVSMVSESDAAAHPSGVTLGTPRYMSYEQLVGASDVDARTDVYAFGVILYEALTGTAPYGDAQSLGDLGVRFATTTPAPPHALRPELPEALSTLVMRALARDRDERLASMDALIEALAPFAEPDRFDEVGTRATVRPRAPRRSLPSRARWTAPGVAVLTIAAALLGLVFLRKPATPDVTAPAARAPAAASIAPPLPRAPLAPPPSAAATHHDDPPARAAAAPDAPPPRTAQRPPPAARRRIMAPARSEAASRDGGAEAPTPDERHRAGQLQRKEF